MCHLVRCACIALSLGYLLGACSQQVTGAGLAFDGGSGGNDTPIFAPAGTPKFMMGSFTWLADRPTAPVTTGIVQLRAATHNLAGLPYAGAAIAFSVQGTGAALSSASGITDANGQIGLTLRSSAMGNFNAVAILGTSVRTIRVSFVRPCAGIHFAAANVVPINSDGAHSLARGDLDGDGDLDLVAEVDAGHVKTMLNNGSAVFTVSAAFVGDAATLTGDGLAATLEDMNGDGQVDVVSSLYGNLNGGIGIYPNTGGGTLGPMQIVPCASDQRPTLGDLDGDGTADIAATGFYTNLVSLCFNNSNPFGFAVTSALTQGGFGGTVALADYDQDGRLDMVVGNPNTAVQNLLSNHGTGAWVPTAPLGSATGAFVMASADFNGDGSADVAMCNSVDGNARVLLGDGTGGFGAVQVYPGITNCLFTHAADLNGDSAPELILGTNTGNSLAVLPNSGNGTFGAPILVDAGAPGPGYITVGDFDADGAPDLAAAVVGGVSVMINQCN